MSTPGDDPVTALAEDLGVPREQLSWLETAASDALANLHAALDAARARQERELAAAFEGTAALIPRPLRGRVRTLLLGR